MELKSTPLIQNRWWTRFRPRSWRDWLAIVGGMLLAGLLCAWLMARTTPRWYQPLDPSAAWVIDTADVAQNKWLALHNTIERVPLGEQTWSITQDEINSLLALRLRRGDLPASDPMVLLTPGRLTLAARSSRLPGDSPGGGVGSMEFDVRSTRSADGQPLGQVTLHRVWAGCLPVPQALIAKRIQAALPAIIQAIELEIELEAGTQDRARIDPYVEGVAHAVATGAPFPLRFEILRRQVAIKEIRIEEGRLTLVLMPPKPTNVAPRPVN